MVGPTHWRVTKSPFQFPQRPISQFFFRRVICSSPIVHRLLLSALHVAPQVKKWDFCNNYIFAHYHRQYTDMANVYKNLMARKIRILVYNGDLDLACNFLGDQWFVDGLNAPLKSNKRAWLVLVSSDNRSIFRKIANFQRSFRFFSFLGAPYHLYN